MPRKPVKSKRGKKLSGATEMHLLSGYCLMCNCQLCSGGPGMSAPLGLHPYSLNENAREIWERNRDRLLAIWRDPDGRGRQPGGSGFNATAYHGAGRTGVPCWAEIRYEGAKLPKMDKIWPADVKKQFRELKDRGF